MNRISIMTLGIVGPAIARYCEDRNMDALKQTYCEILETVSAAGFVGVDVSQWEVSLFGIRYILDVLHSGHLGVSSYIHFDQYACVSDMARRIQKGKEAADIAVSLGTDVLMLVPISHEGIEKDTPELIRATMIDHWQPIVSYALERNLHCVIEDTPERTLCLCKAEEVLAVMDAVPGLELAYDSANMILDGEDPVEYIHHFAGRIGFVHLKNIRILEKMVATGERMRDGRAVMTTPTNDGLVDMRAVIRTLIETGYAGGITVEFAPHPNMSCRESVKISCDFVMENLKKNMV